MRNLRSSQDSLGPEEKQVWKKNEIYFWTITKPYLSPVHKLEKKTPKKADYEPKNLPEASTQREHAAADVSAQDLSRDSSSDALETDESDIVILNKTLDYVNNLSANASGQVVAEIMQESGNGYEDSSQ